jgi:hypothetical protein
MIGDYPVDWTDPHVRALLGVLESVYPMEDIESIVTKAGRGWAMSRSAHDRR